MGKRVSGSGSFEAVPNATAFVMLQAGIPVKVEGDPGGGKTAVTQAFADLMGWPMYTLIGSLRDPADIGGYPQAVKRSGVKDPVTARIHDVAMELVPPSWGLDCWDGRPWIVHCDELTTSPPAVQAAMLRVIQEGCVGDLKLPWYTRFFACCNPPEKAANGFDLTPPMANRFAHLPWSVDYDLISEGFANGMAPASSGKPSFQYGKPRFPMLPEDWWQRTGLHGMLVKGFWKVKPDLRDKYPGSAAEAGRAFPTPRTWDLGIRGMAAMDAAGAPLELQMQALEACVGAEAMIAFRKWKVEMDLPDPEEQIALATKHIDYKKSNGYKLPALGRTDVVWSFLATVTDAVCFKDCTKERREAMGVILDKVWDEYKEVAFVCGRHWARKLDPTDWAPTKMLTEMAKYLGEAGLLGGR